MDYQKIPEEEFLKKLNEAQEEMNTPGICSSCIHLYDESILTCCVKNSRWKSVEYKNKCDIDAWEGFNL